MNLRLIFTLVSLLFVGSAFSQSLYLTCKPLSRPDLKLGVFYKKPPPDARQQFISDIVREGLIVLIYPRPETWVINIAEGRISSPEDNSGFPFKDPSVTDARISATHQTSHGTRYTYDLNRISGKLTYKAYLTEEITSVWRGKHGGTLPNIWQWEDQCSANSRPAI